MLPFRSKLFALAWAVLATVSFASGADAGWVTIKNDTSKAVVVQEVTTVNGKLVRGKPTKLLAGESFREFQNTPGVRTYEVTDAGNAGTCVWGGQLNCKTGSQSFSITTFQGKVGVVQLPEVKKP